MIRFPQTDIEYAMQAEIDTLRVEVERLTLCSNQTQSRLTLLAEANTDLRAENERLRSELQWIADTPMQWTKPQGDIYWSNVATAMALKAQDALQSKGE